ncbi:hypothetical protein ACF3MZ_07190 [Paenibacillaceae bacterium WGS1546]|uniref:hypothetical protein n=1 Tax=Cohnella sp. WGS1546 TaxID=3366810 RepID=UPI00372D80B5
MAPLYIHIDAVRMVRFDTGRLAVALMNAKLGTAATGAGVDGQIRARRGIDSRLAGVNRRLNTADRWMKELDAFLENASLGYNRTEERLIEDARNVKAPWRDSPWWQEWILNPLETVHRFSGDLLELFKDYNNHKGLKIRIYRENGKMMIKILQGNMTYNQFKALLTDRLGTVSAWSRGFTNRLNTTGVSLYDFTTDRPNTRYTRFFGNTNLDDLNRYVNNLGKSGWTVFGTTFRDTALEELKVWNNYRGWADTTKFDKALKGMGIAGDLLAVGGNFADSFYNPRTGKLEYSGKAMQSFVVDTVVDVGTSAAAVATGAALGSFIVPPVGTFVGAGLGFGIDFLINDKFGGPPPKSVVDHTKDAVNRVVDNAGKWARNGLNQIGKRLSFVFG